MFRGFLFSLYGLLSTARNIPGIFQQVRPVVGCGYGQLVAAVVFDRIGMTLDPDETDLDRKSTRLNSSHIEESRMPSSA